MDDQTLLGCKTASCVAKQCLVRHFKWRSVGEGGDMIAPVTVLGNSSDSYVGQICM